MKRFSHSIWLTLQLITSRTVCTFTIYDITNVRKKILGVSAKRSKKILFMNQGNKQNKDNFSLVKETGFEKTINRGSIVVDFFKVVKETGFEKKINRGSIVVARNDIPSLGIWTDQSYVIESIYYQRFNEETNLLEKIEVDTFVDEIPFKLGYEKYMKLYHPVYHEESGAVVVAPEEISLVTLREEVFNSVLFALPMLCLWLSTSYLFVKLYSDRYGGDVLDAFFGRLN